MDRITGQLLDWELGNRDSQTLTGLLKQLHQYHVTICNTDKWDAYAELIPADMLVQTKRETTMIERNNSRLRHWFGRFHRRTLIVSKSIKMVDATLALFATFWVNGSHEHLISLLN